MSLPHDPLLDDATLGDVSIAAAAVFEQKHLLALHEDARSVLRATLIQTIAAAILAYIAHAAPRAGDPGAN